MSDDRQAKDKNQQQPPADGAETLPEDEMDHMAEAPAPSSESGAADLKTELQKAQAAADEYLVGWQRSRAEFANYRKRVDRERVETFQKATFDVLHKMLPVVDDFERALNNLPPEFADHDWVKGVMLIRDKFQAVLQSYEVAEINPLGEPFDPARHEAIGTDGSSEIESGHVTAVIQKGYAYGDHVLRPAMVRVAG